MASEPVHAHKQEEELLLSVFRGVRGVLCVSVVASAWLKVAVEQAAGGTRRLAPSVVYEIMASRERVTVRPTRYDERSVQPTEDLQHQQYRTFPEV